MTMTIKERAGRISTTRDRAGELGARLVLPKGVPDKYAVAWALLRIAFDHGSSIIFNFMNHGPELAGSPFALLRPMNEALKRGTWFAFCATNEETQDFIHNDNLPKRNLAKEIERHPPFDRFHIFTAQYDNAWAKLHSFTHGGAQAVGAYWSGGEVGANFREEDIYHALDHTEAILVLTVHVMCMIAGEFDPESARVVLGDLEKIEPTPPTPPN